MSTPDPANVAAQLAEIADAPRADLLARWRGLHGRPPPKSLSVGVLRQALSFEVQVAAHGGPTQQVVRDLTRLALQADRTPRKARPGLKPGDKLLREWNGQTYVVTVLEQGFEMDGTTWSSLSALARHITGAHWSGPRFFGLASRGPTT